MKTRKQIVLDRQAHMRAMDSSLAYYINQLESFDPKLHDPLFLVSWGRDIQLRPGVSLDLEATSFTRSSFAGTGSQSAQGKPWLNGTSDNMPGVSVNGEKLTTPFRLLGREITFTSVELSRSQKLGQPIDQQKMNGLNNLYQLETDAMVYIGDSDVGAEGLFNSSLVTSALVVAGASTSRLWSTKTPDEILADVNTLLNASWAASGYKVMPQELRLPPTQFALIAQMKVSSAGNVSVLSYLEDNSVALRVNGKKLNIQPAKFLVGIGASGADRMVAYTNAVDMVRFPMAPIARQTAYYQGVTFHAPYIWGYGEVEFVYPETVRYADGI